MSQQQTQKGKLKARLLLVESHVVVRQGITALINQEPDLLVCGGVSATPTALDSIPNLKPDLVLSDITLKNGNGLEMIKIITAQYNKLPVLVVTMHDERLYAEIALRSGAMGYIMKEEPIEKLLLAIRRVLSGKIYLSENASHQIIRQQIRGTGKSRSSPEELLSDRELQVFQMIGQWCRTSQIARELHLSVKTVQYYREKIKEKLHLPEASDLTRFATECARARPLPTPANVNHDAFTPFPLPAGRPHELGAISNGH
jgi:DNA-binding NarL/FixJ family response regulator